ncbi:EAL domain-containing protein [Crenobacter sp. SG2305]|uniref:bifunctional diguanylate cyclase/phosphodiesterase n=1 Tax=Crenobacter oryzisoli TaxID=3056844 RepID=UPI0025AAE240|nr:EAL domain-containing protein [Crenobacter sp. SG2305]MDN0081245.1 EAL domain-containing protein [Crenobacter sp. SG2305]
MTSSADNLIAPPAALDKALALLARHGSLSALAIWARRGNRWQQLAALGHADSLPSADVLEAGLAAPADGGALPLRDAGQAIGWLIWRGHAGPDLDALAELMTGHLLCVRLRDALNVSRLSHEILLDISQLGHQCGHADELAQQFLRRLERLMDAQHCYIALLDEEHAALRFPLYRDDRHPLDPMHPAADALPPRLVGYLMQSGQPLHYSRDALQRLIQEQRWPCPPHLSLPTSGMAVPLINALGQPIGALVLQRYQDMPLSTAEQASLLLLARHLGFALDTLRYPSQLERQVQYRTNELEGINARLRAEVADRQHHERLHGVLYRIAELTNTSLSLGAFLAGLHRLLAELMPADHCQVALYDAGQDLLSFPYNSGAGSPSPRRPGRGPIEQVLHSGRPLLSTGNTQGDGKQGSWLGVPLFSEHNLLGVLAVSSEDSAARFSLREQEILEFVANHIGAALSRLRALEALQGSYAALEARVRERTSELDAVNAQLKYDSLHDPLTNLPNRSHFARTLRESWEQFVSGGHRFAVLFIDLDRFKRVNDTLGHLAGDHLLFEVGARLHRCLRQTDFLARIGGDEFAVLLSNVKSFDDCEPIARRIVAEFEHPVILHGREVFTSASVGVVLADRDLYHQADDLLRDADHAMYRTKQQGRHGYTLFNHALRRDQADQLALESELRRALEEQDQLIPYYQPFVHAITGELVGLETLVRWRHPERGMLVPATFLPVAEESGLIVRLDRYMIEAACRQLTRWQLSGQVTTPLALHINLSSSNFHDPGFVAWLTQLVRQHDLQPGTLYLEITESALIDEPDTAAMVMAALRKLGVRLALDDFGTGYSALSYLHRYRFDKLKIDRAFVSEVDSKGEADAIVRAILALAEALGLEVVAEGVETEGQLRRLSEMGCHTLQGFYFAAPAPAEQLDWSRLALPLAKVADHVSPACQPV